LLGILYSGYNKHLQPKTKVHQAITFLTSTQTIKTKPKRLAKFKRQYGNGLIFG